MIITISGTPGSGKSTLAKGLAQKLKYPYLYMGGFRREVARKHGITLAELNKIGETEAWTDLEADDYLRAEAARQPNAVIDSRVAFHFLPQSLKVFISVDPHVGAERIFGALQKNPDKRNEAAALHTVSDVERVNQERIASDQHRYLKYYQVDYLEPANYDFVLDTTALAPAQALKALWQRVEQYLQQTSL